MTKIAIWCRHKNDNIIGIGAAIPWHVKSDFQRFRRITEGQTLVAGQKTYENCPNRTLPNRKIFVLTLDENYEVSDSQNHSVVNDIKFFKDFEDDLSIVGGATVYKLFMTGSNKLIPDIVVDCIYQKDINPNLKGEPVDITDCIDVLNKKYIQVSLDYEQDDITTRILIRKGEFVEQSVLKKIVKAIEEGIRMEEGEKNA